MARYRLPNGVVVNVSDDRQPGHGWEPLDEGGSQPAWDDLTVDELKDEIRRRNDGRDDDSRLVLTGTKAELVAQLDADDRD